MCRSFYSFSVYTYSCVWYMLLQFMNKVWVMNHYLMNEEVACLLCFSTTNYDDNTQSSWAGMRVYLEHSTQEWEGSLASLGWCFAVLFSLQLCSVLLLLVPVTPGAPGPPPGLASSGCCSSAGIACMTMVRHSFHPFCLVTTERQYPPTVSSFSRATSCDFCV